MQDIFPYTINYNIIPMNTKYKLEDTLEDEKYVNVLLYTIEFQFVNLNVGINSFIYCSLNDDTNIKDNIKTYIQVLEQLEACTTTDDINNILNESKSNEHVLFGSSVWLLNDVNNILHNADTSKFINGNILIKDIDKLSNDELYNKNIMHFVHLNKYIINKLNDVKDNIYSDDELASFTSTFFNIILKSYKENNGDNNGGDNSEKTQLDNIYNKVMNYYILSKNDTTSSDIDLILSSSYNSIRQDWDTDNVTSSCGCNATSNSYNSLNTTSCYNIYKQAMSAWLKQMMSDIENFYYKYFTIKSTTDDGKECYNINNDLIDDLLELIKEFKNVGYDLSFSTDTNKFRNCNCEMDNSSVTNDCNYKTIEDFEKVLYIIKEDKIDENYNKIKLTGRNFATLLDKLYF